MKLFWGTEINYINITNICYNKLLKNNLITICKEESFKLNIFGDPVPGIIKHIKIIDNFGNTKIFNEYNEDIIIDINSPIKNDLEIFWGILDNYINITNICYNKCTEYNNIIIPKEESSKLNIFGDPVPGIIKHIKIIDKFNNYKIYDCNEQIFIPNNIKYNFEYKEFEINYMYKNLYEYDRNIPKNYNDLLNLYNEECKKKLDFKNMEKKIPDKEFTQSVFHDLLDKDKYIFDKSKLITLDIILNKSFSFKCIKTRNLYRTSKNFHFLIKNKVELSASEYDDVVVYVFDDIHQPFFVVLGAGSNYMVLHTHILFIYYFKSNELFYIKYFDHSYDSKEKNCYNILNYFNNNIIKNSVKTVTLFGFSINIGHSYWNDVSGFKFLLDLDLLKLIDNIIIGPYDYYNLSIFLEKNNYTYIKEDKLELINEHINNNNLFFFKYNELFMYEDLKKFVIENNIFTDIEEINYINKVKENHYPILTFNLRAVHRNLYNQEDAFSNIINNLLELYPKMFVIFDGYIKNKNTVIKNYVSEGVYSDDNIFDTSYNNILNNIISKLNTKNYISLIGTTLERQIAWLEISDYGFMQLGAGAFNYTWLMNKKCIFIPRNLYVNKNILVDSFHDFIFREKRDFTTYINPNIIDFETYKNPNREFFINWETIYNYIYRDLVILKENNFKLLQYENLEKYNILQKVGLSFEINNKSLLIVICSKSPNPLLYKCIDNLYKIQLDNRLNFKICVIDSDSDDLTNYKLIKNDFPDVEILFIKNKNYEYGAWKYAYSIYQNYDLYFCIQDTILIEKKIPLNIIDNCNTYTFHNYTGYSLPSGYYSQLEVKEAGIKNLENSNLDYENIIDTNFCLAQHSSFIVNNYIMNDIFLTLKKPPINKIGCCFYERNFGLFFILKKINTIDLHNYMIKIHGGRD